MSRHIRLGYGRLAVVALAMVATTWGAGAAVAASGSAATSDALAAATTAPGTTAPGASLPSGSGSVPGSTAPTPCPPGPGTAGTAPPPASDFEDGSVGRWTADAGVTLTNTGEAAADGQRSLRADGVTATGGVNLPAIPSQAQGADWHRVTAKVRLAPGSAPAYVKLEPTSGYSTVPGVVRATADTWTTITAWYWPGTVYWDNFCNGQMYGGSFPGLASLKVLLSGDACSDATDGPVTLFVDDVVTELVTSSAPPAGPPPEPASTPQCASGPSSPHTSPPAPVCTARYDTVGHWSTGYLATLHVVNASGTPLPARTLTWQFPGKQVITSLWGAKDYRQSGPRVTVTTPLRSGLAPGRALDVGFIATGTAGVPQSVTLDGTTCGVTSD